MGRYSVIDVGSNTVHLLVGRVEDGVVLPVTGEKVSIRLGSGVQGSGRIEDGRLAVGVEAIGLFASIADLNGASGPAVLATSAVRDAENGEDLVDGVMERAGLEVRRVTGEEEALLGFRGAISTLGKEQWGRPVLVFDLGGGSAQLVFGEAGSDTVPDESVSLPLGTSRTTEKFVDGDPPALEELERVREYTKGTLPDWELPEETEVVAVGGSARAILKVTRDELTAERLAGLAGELCDAHSAHISREKGLTPERARVIPAAVTTLAALLEHYGRPSLQVARGGIREGALLSMAGGEL